MRPLTSIDVLDEILSLQLLLSWAGERGGDAAPRLGWWGSDLVDEDGGGDLWRRLLPRTHAWAGLDAARRAARRVDGKAREPLARRDDMVSLFHFGFELDEALDERLAQHRLEAKPPASVLPVLDLVRQPFVTGTVLSAISKAPPPTFAAVPSGRQIKGEANEDAAARARRLAVVLLVDPPAQYPMAFVLEDGRRAER